MENRLRVSEIFGITLQGEGASVGKPVLFLRLSGCNLACEWCDTPYTWNWKGSNFVHPVKYDPKEEMKFMTWQEIYTELTQKALPMRQKALVISGGEPLLQQERLIPLLEKLREDNWHVEIETNGAVVPSGRFLDLVSQVNCSPKLSSSGPDNSLVKRIVPEALTALVNAYKAVYFKFVVANDSDIQEILDLVDKFKLRNVYLMPEGRTKEEQDARQNQVVDLCIKHGFTFSSRLHITLWGTKRGV